MTKTFEEIQDAESVSSIKSFEEWEVKNNKRDIKEKKNFRKGVCTDKKEVNKRRRKALQSLSFGGRLLWRGKMQEDCNATVGFPNSVTLACWLVQEGAWA